MAKNQHAQRKILLKNVSLSKIGPDFSNKVVQKLTLEKNNCIKRSPKLIFFLIEKTNKKHDSLDFLHLKLTLKLQFWHFSMNCKSSAETL